MSVKKILICFIMFLSIPLVAKSQSASCTPDELARLGQVANNTQINYEFDDTTETYKIIVNNFSMETYISNRSQGVGFVYEGGSTIEKSGFTPGITYELPFYGSSLSDCRDKYLVTKMVYLPAYNSYYKDPLCVGYEDYELCKKFTPIVVYSYEDFEQRVKQHIEDLKNQRPNNNSNDESNVKENLWDKAITFFISHNLYFLIPIIVLGTTGIIIIQARRKKEIL